MNRAFASLYLIIVLSILLLGLVLNKFWDEVNPPQALDPAVVDLISLIEQSLQSSPNPDRQQQLTKMTAQLKYKASLVSITNFSSTAIAERIKQGDVVSIADEHTNYYYKRLANTNDVLLLAYSSESNNRSELYVIFILIFYGAIAGVVFLWVWPLTRDLARLSQHAQQIGKENLDNESLCY